jgi:hypothetical protein
MWSTVFFDIKMVPYLSRPYGSSMQPQHFDLNDILHEPTDQQLDALMTLVAAEAKRRAEVAREALMVRLRTEIAAVNRPSESA